jgi:hypothetical protein
MLDERPDAQLEALKRLYGSCKDRFQMEEKLREGSVFLSCLEVKNNVRFKLLNEAAVESFRIETGVLADLVAEGLVRQSANASSLTLTAKGIWDVEKSQGIIDEARLVEYLDQKHFDLFGGTPKLTDREKVIILSLIAARAFSKESCVDLHKDDATMDIWQRIIEKSLPALKDLGIAGKLSSDVLLARRGNEHPVSDLLRHSDALQRKTKLLFLAPGKQKYYLGLYDGSTIAVDKLGFLFHLIFEDRLDVDDMDKVLALCADVAHNDGILVFDPAEHPFAKPGVDDKIRESLIRSQVSREYPA